MSRTGTTSLSENVTYGMGGTATQGTDYTTMSGGTLTFAPTDTSNTFTITATPDTTLEPDETVVVTILAMTRTLLTRQRHRLRQRGQ